VIVDYKVGDEWGGEYAAEGEDVGDCVDVFSNDRRAVGR
jgi:hypothetical protein